MPRRGHPVRPRGEFALALARAASTPGTVRQLCERSQVGYTAGSYTATRMVQRGELVPVADLAPRTVGPGRPPVLLVAAAAAPAPADPTAYLLSFWERPAAADSD